MLYRLKVIYHKADVTNNSASTIALLIVTVPFLEDQADVMAAEAQ